VGRARRAPPARVAESAGDRSAAPTELCARCLPARGQRAGQGGQSAGLPNRDAYTLPITATPRVPTEQPRGVIHRRAHARLRPWATSMIASVAGALVNPSGAERTICAAIVP